MKSTTALQFRRASENDEAPLLAMMEDFNHIEGIPWRAEEVWGALRQLLNRPDLGMVVVAELGDALCAYFVMAYSFDLEFCGRDAFITEVYVIPDQRGRGLGRQLLTHAQRLARAEEVRALHLGVLPNDVRARSLYRSLGFVDSPYVFMTKTLVDA